MTGQRLNQHRVTKACILPVSAFEPKPTSDGGTVIARWRGFGQ
jgi:hypothetical protein